jgi:tripartite-type tricarboxylate transporter receptor subunit TctC
MLAPLLAEMLELPLRIENLPKGEGAQGYKELINSKPDGHTIGIYNPGHISNSRDITGIYDFNTIDMTFLYQITDEPSVVTIYTGEESKFSSFEELYEYSREKPVRAATTSGTSKIGPILMKVLWGMNLVFVPFASSTEGRAALMRGDVELSVYSIGSSLEAVSASKDLKVGLIISGKKSASEIDVVPVYEKLYDISLADVPTSAGLNLPSNDDMAAVVSAYRTIIGPPKMPAEIANKVMDAFDRLFEEYKDTLDRLQKKWNRPLSGLARGDIPKERQMRAFEVLKQYRDLMVG